MTGTAQKVVAYTECQISDWEEDDEEEWCNNDLYILNKMAADRTE